MANLAAKTEFASKAIDDGADLSAFLESFSHTDSHTAEPPP
jgi:hypothetical protein